MTVRHRRALGLAAAGIVALYVATRVSVMDRLPYFIDEGFFGQFTNQGAHSLHMLFVSLTIGKEPMQAWLGIPWVKLGLNPLVAGRLVSAIAGLLTVGVIGLLGRRLGGALVGWVAAALAVVLPFFFVNDAVGIVEPLVTLIVALALLLSLELAIRPGLKLGALLGVVLAIGVLTKQNTEPALLLVPLSMCCFDWGHPARRRRLVVWFEAAALAYLFVVGAELLLRASSYYRLSQLARNSLFYPARSVTAVLEDPFLTSAAAWRAFRPALSGYLTIPLLAVALVGATLAWRERRRMAAVLLASTLVLFLIALTFTVLPYPRNIMYVTPMVVVLMAYGLVRGARWTLNAVPRRVAAAVCTVSVALLLTPALRFDESVLADPATAHYPGLDYWQYVIGPVAGGVWPPVARAIRDQAGPGPVVILAVSPSFDVLSLLLSPSSRFVFVTAASPLAPRARFAVSDASTFTFDRAAEADLSKFHFRLIRRFPRPQGPCHGPRESTCGRPVTLYGRPGFG